MYRTSLVPLLTAVLLPGAVAPSPTTLDFSARYELVVHPPSGARQLRVWFPVPRADPAQEISELEIDAPVSYRITEDARGNRLAYLEMSSPPAEVRVVSTFDVRRHEARSSIDPGRTRAPDAAEREAHARWLEPDEHVVINDRIRQLAAEITSGEPNPVRAARAIYDWVLENIDYWVKEPALKKASKVGSTTYCLNTGTGNCTDFHSLYASLSRAAGIPTRILYGSLFKPELDGQDVDASYHCWLEFHAPQIGWVPLDVAVADIYHGPIEIDDANRTLVSRTTADGYEGPDPARVDYYFGNLEPRRVTWTEGRDLLLEPPRLQARSTRCRRPMSRSTASPWTRARAGCGASRTGAGEPAQASPHRGLLWQLPDRRRPGPEDRCSLLRQDGYPTPAPRCCVQGNGREFRRLRAMESYCDHHATIFLSGDAAVRTESVRRRWDPAMAAQVAAHVTVIYPHEAPDAALLDDRLRNAALASAPFRLRLGRVACFGRPECGVYVEVEDLDDGLARLRSRVLAPPFDPLDFPPHVTLVHPRTSDRAHEFWSGPRDEEFGEEFCVSSVAITALDGRKCGVLSAYTLG